MNKPVLEHQTIDFHQLLKAMPRALGEPSIRAGFRQYPDDFFVQEVLSFDFEGSGDHLCLLLEKTQLNTQDVIDRLVSVLGVKGVDIGYFGLKDKRAVTQQWFSIHLPGKEVTAKAFDLGEGVTVLERTRHNRKIRIGSHKGNRFRIVLRDIAGNTEEFSDRIETCFRYGFPNYFAEQRFGYGAQNIARALTLFRADATESLQSGSNTKRKRQTRVARSGRRPSRRQQTLYLSAARSFLFNRVLAERLGAGTWLQPLRDEKLILSGSHSYFDYNPSAESGDIPGESPAPGRVDFPTDIPADIQGENTPAMAEETLSARLQRQDIHTSGVLWGAGDSICDWERICLKPFAELTSGLEKAGLKVARRALRASVTNANLSWQNDDVAVLEFELPTGCYATSLLREACTTVVV